MAVIVPNEGESLLLNMIRDPSSYGGHTVSCLLFKSNTTPSASTTIGSLTLCDFSGYSAQSVSWGSVATDGGGKASMTATEVTFSHDGGGTANDVYGWAITLDNAGIPDGLICIERFDTAPALMNDNTDSISITPTFKLFD